MMKKPPFLQADDLIAIPCPSGYMERYKAEAAKVVLESWGYRVLIGQTVGHGANYFAGTDAERLEELQGFLDDPEVKVVLCGRGGYGLSRIIDRLDLDGLAKSPKWIIGFSDITVLHSQVNVKLELPTIHGPMCSFFVDVGETLPNDLAALKELLKGKGYHYQVAGHPLNNPGETTGVLVGGNLALLAHLCGSESQIETKDRILFIEDVGEYLYSVDRMLLTLKRAGMLQGLRGLVFGTFSEMKDTTRPFGIGLRELLYEQVKDYGYPVVFDFPSGHIPINYPLILGWEHRLQVGKGVVELEMISPLIV